MEEAVQLNCSTSYQFAIVVFRNIQRIFSHFSIVQSLFSFFEVSIQWSSTKLPLGNDRFNLIWRMCHFEYENKTRYFKCAQKTKLRTIQIEMNPRMKHWKMRINLVFGDNFIMNFYFHKKSAMERWMKCLTTKFFKIACTWCASACASASLFFLFGFIRFGYSRLTNIIHIEKSLCDASVDLLKCIAFTWKVRMLCVCTMKIRNKK